MSKRTCIVDGCTNKSRSRGMCQTHYMRWYRTGDAENIKRVIPKSAEESFSMNTTWVGQCLLWNSSNENQDYGQIRIDGKRMGAHRYAWERVNGAIPDGMKIDHICHNPSCVNSNHLRLASDGQNASYRSGPTRDNKTSGIRNVYRGRNKWIVNVYKNRKNHYFGSFDTIEEAAQVAEEARRELFGEFAGRG